MDNEILKQRGKGRTEAKECVKLIDSTAEGLSLQGGARLRVELEQDAPWNQT